MKLVLPPIPTPEGAIFQKIDHLFRSVIIVSKEEIDRSGKEWHRGRKPKRQAKSRNPPSK
jgi:hypothetical protein